CSCAFPPDYWSYWHLRDGSWAYASVGASSYTVHDGDVEGWSWGAGEPPALFTFDQICAPSSAAEVAPAPSVAALPLATPHAAAATPELAIPSPSASGQPAQQQTSDSPSPAGYVVFAVIAVVLGGILLLPRIRRRL
ncbi:MAG TPA: hypothetical protein VFL17_15425, partial [Anaerolineae bacterium]|nr:hypothetical protein [Anaerolineae bacterium]